MRTFILSLCLGLLCVTGFTPLAAAKGVEIADEIGFIDDITINGREFDSLEQREIEFYPEDLQDGKVVVQGLLESLEDKVKVEELHVEITTDGGKSWNRALGLDEWEWSFRPEFEQVYEFSLRVVKDTVVVPDYGHDDHDTALPDLLRIGGFELRLEQDAKIAAGRLSGRGLLQIPFFANCGHSTSIDVHFDELVVVGDRIVSGEVICDEGVDLQQPLVAVHLSRIVVAADQQKSSIAGSVHFKNSFEFLPTLAIAEASSLHSDSIHLELAVQAQQIDIWQEKNVRLAFDSGTIILDYALRDDEPRIRGDSLNPRLEFGELLRADQAVVAEVALFAQPFGQIPLYFTDIVKAHLVDSDIAIEGINASLDLSKKEIHIISSLNCEDYDDLFVRALTGSQLIATLSEQGFEGQIRADGGLPPLVLLDRGGSGKDVELRVAGTPTFNVVIDKSGLDFDYGQLSAELSFGDILQGSINLNGGALDSIVATMDQSAQQPSLRFSRTGKVYLLGQDLALGDIRASFDLARKTISLRSDVDLTATANPLVRSMKSALLIAEVSSSGLHGKLTPRTPPDPLTIFDGGHNQRVTLEFDSAPTIDLAVVNRGLDFTFAAGLDGARLHFGRLFDGATATLGSAEDAIKRVYPWRVTGRKGFAQGSKIFVEDVHGTLDLSDFDNPWLNFNAQADLSGVGQAFSAISSVRIEEGLISKDGLCARVQVELDDLDVWQDQQVKVRFTRRPIINLSYTRQGFVQSLSNLRADLYFGQLLDNAVATIRSTQPDDPHTSCAMAGIHAAAPLSAEYLWSIDGMKQLADTDINLYDLSGSITLTEFSNPTITLNALADLRGYGGIFKNIASAGLEDGTISSTGFDGRLTVGLSDIDIWKDKNVKVVFRDADQSRFNLSVTASGFDLSLVELNADVDFGDLLSGAKSRLDMVGHEMYGWSLRGRFPIDDSELVMEDLVGRLDLSDLKAPVLTLDGRVDLSRYHASFKTVKAARLFNARISKFGFRGGLRVDIGDIDIWKQKRVKIGFVDGQSPTLSLNIERDTIDIGFIDLNADLDFGQLMDGEVVRLRSRIAAEGLRGNLNGQRRWNSPSTPSLPNGARIKKPDDVALPPCVYDWQLQNQHQLIEDENGSVTVVRAAGTINACDFDNPIITFNAQADFSDYYFANVQFGDVTLSDATISKEGIDYNLAFTGAATEITILDLGGRDSDVWLELSNVDGHVNNGEAGIGQADGVLYFGELFEGRVDPVDLTYRDSGLYTFSTNQIFTYRHGQHSVVLSGLAGEVQQVGESYRVTLAGNSVVHTPLLDGIGLQQLDIQQLEINQRGLIGHVRASLRAEDRVFNLINNQLNLVLEAAEVRIDSASEQPVLLTELDGYLDFSPIFDEDGASAHAQLHYENGRVNWNFDHSLHLNNNFIFDGLHGSLDLDPRNDLTLSFGGRFNYRGIDDLNIELENFVIDAGGINGTVRYDASLPIAGVDGLELTDFHVSFGQQISGGVRLSYQENGFLGSNERLQFELEALITRNGMDAFSLDGNGLRNIVIRDFATISFSDVTVSPSLDNFEIVLDGTIKPTNSLFRADYALEFEGLKISADGIAIAGVGGEFPVSGSSADLGGLDLSLESLGIGFSGERFYVSAKGSLSLLVTEAGAGLRLYSDGGLDVDSIKVVVNNPALTFGGDISWYNNDRVYGNGFGADGLQLKLANMFSVGGMFKIGDKRGKGFYWMAKAQAGLGSGIPLGPFTVYELGGGAAYNMSYSDQNPHDTVSGEFVPSGRGNVVIIISSLLGTSDMGFTWHGQVDINMDSAGQLIIEGDTYILCPKDEKLDDKKISGTIVLGFTPASLHISGRATINYMDVIGLRGGTDIMFSGAEKHVFVGSDERAVGFNVSHNLGNVEVNTFGLRSRGYFMIDTRRLAFGAGYDFNRKLSLDVWGPDPYIRLRAHARADALMQYNPFFMDLSAEAGVSLTAGYAGLDYTIAAWLELRLRAPSPTYMKVKAGVRIPVYGSANFTTYFPGRPSGGGGDNLPTLINHIEPYVHDDISLMPRLRVVSTFNSDGSRFNVGDMEPRINVDGSDGQIVETLYFTSNVHSVQLLDLTTRRVIPCSRTQISSNEIEFIPTRTLVPGRSYRFAGSATLQKRLRTTTADLSSEPTMYNDDRTAADILATEAQWFRLDPEAYMAENRTHSSSTSSVVKAERFSEEFTVRNERRLEFTEIVTSVYPENLQKDVREIEPIVITYDRIVETLGPRSSLIRNYRVEVMGSDHKNIDGMFRYDDVGVPKTVFQPATPLRIYHYCVDTTTGERRETFINNENKYLNPFNDYTVDGENVGEAGKKRVGMNIPTELHVGPLDQGVNIGTLEHTVGNYEYYTNADYTILVTDRSTNQIVYVSTFTVKYNKIATDELRKFDAMGDQVSPSLVYRRHLGSEDIVFAVIDPDLNSIGINPNMANVGTDNQGVGCMVDTVWMVQREGYLPEQVTKRIEWGVDDPHLDFGEQLPTQVLDLSRAMVTYYDATTPDRRMLARKIMTTSEGPAYHDSSQIEEAASQDRIVAETPMDRIGGGLRERGRSPDVSRGSRFDVGRGQQFNLGVQ